MENDKLEILRLKNLNEVSKKTIADLKTKMEQIQTESYTMGKAKEKVDYEMDNMQTEMRRLQESVELFNKLKKSLADKVSDSKDAKAKQTESYQNIIKNLLTLVKAYQRYTDTVERSFVSSYENLLLLVDYKFDSIREAKKDITKLDLDPKERKLLPAQSQSLVDVINDYNNPINYDELDKIFSKTVKDLRGRKFLDEKEANNLFENVLGGGASAAGTQGVTGDVKKPDTATLTSDIKSGAKGLSIPAPAPIAPVTVSI